MAEELLQMVPKIPIVRRLPFPDRLCNCWWMIVTTEGGAISPKRSNKGPREPCKGRYANNETMKSNAGNKARKK
jgi:hypothetical protein